MTKLPSIIRKALKFPPTIQKEINISNLEVNSNTNKTILIGPHDPSFAGIHSAASHVESIFSVPYVYLEDVLKNPSVYKDSNIIFEGWIPPYQKVINCTGGRHFVRYQSPLTQMELSGKELDQILFLKSAKDAKKIDGVFVTSESLFRSLQPFAEWWPNAINTKLFQVKKSTKEDNTVGLLMTYSPRKNLASNLFAARLMGTKVFCNDNIPLVLKQLAKQFSITVSYSPRTDDIVYRELLSRLILNMQVTLSESLNYGIVDSMLSGTPSLIGPNTPLANLSKSYDSLCKINTVDNPIEIARKGRTLLKSKVCQEDALGFGLEMLETYSQRANEVTNALIERWKF